MVELVKSKGFVKWGIANEKLLPNGGVIRGGSATNKASKVSFLFDLVF